MARAHVRRGEVSRARHTLTATPLAPGDEATWEALTDPARRRPRHAPWPLFGFFAGLVGGTHA